MPTKRAQNSGWAAGAVKPFLATAAVWLDSAARRCGLLLRFCVRKISPAAGRTPTRKHVNNFYDKALASIENIWTVLVEPGTWLVRKAHRGLRNSCANLAQHSRLRSWPQAVLREDV